MITSPQIFPDKLIVREFFLSIYDVDVKLVHVFNP